MSKVSVIVPAYNAEKVIERCVNSILNQEYKDLECIVVDDGSKDSTPQILDTLAQKDERLHVIHKENGGVSKARNTALEVVNGEYVQFLDADDWIPTDSTKLLVRSMEESNADLVIGHFYRVVGENVALQGSIDTTKPLTLLEFAQLMMDSPADYYYGVLWNKLYKASILKQYHLQMDEKIQFAEDFIFNLEYLLHVKTIVPLKAPIYYYVKTEGSLVSQGMSLTKLYQMKTYVFTYYDAFYKNILNEEEYRRDRLQITSFLIDGAKDEFAFSVLPGVKKLGEERVQAKYETNQDTMIAFAYYLNKSFDQKLNTIAQQYDMNLNDIKVFASLIDANSINTVEDISDYTGILEINVSLIITKLMLKRLVSIQVKENKTVVSLTEISLDLQKQIQQALIDLESVLFEDITDIDQKQFHSTIRKMISNMRKIV